MNQVLDATFRPAEVKTLWRIQPTDWGSLQSRQLVEANTVTAGTREQIVMNVVQAAQLGVQMALLRQLGLSHRDAHRLAKECGTHIEQLFRAPDSVEAKQILFAVTTGSDTPKWRNISLDTPLDVIEHDPGFSGRPWVVLDVMHFVREVCQYVADKHPEAYARWKAQKRARRN